MEGKKFTNLVNEPVISYKSLDDGNILDLIRLVRKGLSFAQFRKVFDAAPFSLSEWRKFLHLSERTLHRYEAANESFDPIQSERILQIAMLNKLGTEVFGKPASYHSWLDAPSVALGHQKPKELLDSIFGIGLVKDELGRISHGVLA
jgi:putative toxin-antitoxin system antitoxin component (TIGR02293 family)